MNAFLLFFSTDILNSQMENITFICGMRTSSTKSYVNSFWMVNSPHIIWVEVQSCWSGGDGCYFCFEFFSFQIWNQFYDRRTCIYSVWAILCTYSYCSKSCIFSKLSIVWRESQVRVNKCKSYAFQRALVDDAWIFDYSTDCHSPYTHYFYPLQRQFFVMKFYRWKR